MHMGGPVTCTTQKCPICLNIQSVSVSCEDSLESWQMGASSRKLDLTIELMGELIAFYLSKSRDEAL